MKITRPLIVKRAIQLVACFIGTIGLVWMFFGFNFIGQDSKESYRTGLIITAMFLGFGGMMIAVAYQVIFRFSKSAVTNISALVGFVVYGFVVRYIRVILDGAWSGKNAAAQFFWFVLPIAIAWVFYQIMKRVLLKLTTEK